MEVSMIAALLSAFVFQEKSDIKMDDILAKMKPEVQAGVDIILNIATNVAEIQRQAGLDVSVEDYVRDHVNFGLLEVVYEWSNGTAFKAITELTDVLEGTIVRTITRLDELCREIRDAARIIGNASLYRSMDEASMAIKRDVIFAASLYV
jgi:antiviral helicase SKI2